MDENDWIFDFVLQFLESDKFDAAVMDFVDEKCYVFDNDEENKFIYTDIYHEFIDHMETIIASNLHALDITTEVFYEACQTSRNSREINKTVYEKMLAMEDFTVFKKIMIKRNTELQYEAMMAYKHLVEFSDMKGELDDLPDPEELEHMLDQRDDDHEISGHTSEELENMYRDSLLELEMIHKQEEIEQLELEQALAMSLVAEEERLRLARIEAKNRPDDEEDNEDDAGCMNGEPTEADAKYANYSETKGNKPAAAAPEALNTSFADPKPIRPAPGGMSLSPMKALPPISAGKKASLAELNSNYKDKKKRADDAFKLNQIQLNEKRRQQEELTKDIPAAQQEAERRAKYMAEQRDRLIALKKKEREEKVRLEDERLRKQQRDQEAERRPNKAREEKKSCDDDDDDVDSQEAQRAAMRMALARMMKQGLLESEEAKLMAQHEEQFSSLDQRLREVEKQRQDNQQRERILQENLRKQQAQIARNVQRSAAVMRHQDK